MLCLHMRVRQSGCPNSLGEPELPSGILGLRFTYLRRAKKSVKDSLRRGAGDLKPFGVHTTLPDAGI